MLYSLEQIRESVDWAIGDDGFRSNEVIEILKNTKEYNMQPKRIINSMKVKVQLVRHVDIKLIKNIIFLLK